MTRIVLSIVLASLLGSCGRGKAPGGAGEPGIEAAAHPVGHLALGCEFRVQGTDQPAGDGALAAGPSEGIPEEAQSVLGGGRALCLRLVLLHLSGGCFTDGGGRRKAPEVPLNDGRILVLEYT